MPDNTPQDPAAEEIIVAPDFGEFLDGLDRGRVTSDLGAALAEVTAAVKRTGKAGKVSLTLSLGWDGKARMLRVAPNVTAKTPRLDRPEALFFVDEHGRPTKNDPAQYALELSNRERTRTGHVAPHADQFIEPNRAD